ncbi:hypothetical protein BDN72DRAFT_963959 [Pluteus cervinus]|uniref:Uncharacterized protein n=1 Tax=Pluteus cervinus TaxID=181527 RepID=A0ACD3ACK1_9AGAR|nr:hypothetical protein BDN72DRAFT_963959 [Pluteus cervinus]
MASTSFNICGLTLEAAYEKLDEEIAWLQSRLSSLCTLRNSLAPISKLPVELTSKIFAHTQRDGLVLSMKADLRSRLLISWVCRRWRDIALTTPNLWTTISKINKTTLLQSDCVQELLLRSRGMGLTVNLCEPSHDALEIFLEHMSRMKHFRLKYNQLRPGNQLIRPAPALVSLELIKVLPPSTLIFGGDYPHLRHLSLKNIPFTKFYFPCHLIQSLTTLRIIESGPVRVGELVNILPLLPNLLRLELVRSLSLENIRPPPRRFQLPSLEAICFIDEKHDIIFNLLLHCFDIPQVAVTIAWSARPGNGVSERHMENLRAKIDFFLCEANIPIRHLKICRDDPDYIVDISSSPSQHRYSFDFSHRLSCHVTSNWLRLVIPSHNIETLDINDLPKDTLEVIKHALYLRSVRTSGVDATLAFIEALGRVQTILALPFPSLRELTIHGVDFEAWHGMKALGGILTKRHEAGSGLHKLVLMECKNVDIDNFKNSVRVTEGI